MSEALKQNASDSNQPDLSILLITLLKGVLYRDGDLRLWSTLLRLRFQASDYMTALGLDLMVDEIEGYAFLRSRVPASGEEEGTPRLVARRPLTFYDSLLLALLRKKLAEFDATGTESRLVLRSEQIFELIQLFLPEGTDEVKLQGKVEQSMQRLQEMGFLRRLKSSQGEVILFEVMRIIKAFVDAQWLRGLNESLAAYREHAQGM